MVNIQFYYQHSHRALLLQVKRRVRRSEQTVQFSCQLQKCGKTPDFWALRGKLVNLSLPSLVNTLNYKYLYLTNCVRISFFSASHSTFFSAIMFRKKLFHSFSQLATAVLRAFFKANIGLFMKNSKNLFRQESWVRVFMIIDGGAGPINFLDTLWIKSLALTALFIYKCYLYFFTLPNCFAILRF